MPVGVTPLLRRLVRDGQAAQTRETAGFPRRKRRLVPVRWYHGTFAVVDARHVRVGVAKGAPPLVLGLARPIPYDPARVRSVELSAINGRLWLAVTAEVPVETHDLDRARVVGVDLGIIHPYALAGPDGQAMILSGRALRAEHRLHLADTKARQAKMASKHARRRARPGIPPDRGSRRWRKLRDGQRRAEARHRRRIRHAHHRAANVAVDWCIALRVGTLVIGDPDGICDRNVGTVQHKRLRDWSRTHLTGCLADQARQHGLTVVEVDERGTSSTCPACGRRVPKPRGRLFTCPSCAYTGHRDLVGAHNIARKTGGPQQPLPATVEHRRVGQPAARRDRRRHRWHHHRTRRQPALPSLGPPTPWESHATPGVDQPNTQTIADEALT